MLEIDPGFPRIGRRLDAPGERPHSSRLGQWHGGGGLTALIPLDRALRRVARRLRSARSLRIASDYDGTLATIEWPPHHARLNPRVRRALAALRQRRGVCLAVLSGRRLDDLRRRIPWPGVFLAGSSGLETLDGRGRRRIHAGRGVRLPKELRASLGAWCARFQGTWLEDKGPSLAVHDRELEARRRGAFVAGVMRRFEPYADRARILRGRHVFEILLGQHVDKAVALRPWLGRDRTGALFYFGDDTNDESVLRLVTRLGGFAIAVGRRVPGARYHLAGADAVARFLTWLEGEWVARPAPRRNARRAATGPGRPRRRPRP
jgi:trehalose-phosphatase